MDYVIKGKNDWSYRCSIQSIYEHAAYLRKKMELSIGIPAERLGDKSMWMPYEDYVFQQKFMEMRMMGKQPRDIDVHLAIAMDRAEKENKQLVVFNKRHRP